MHVFAATEIAAALQLTVSPGLAGRFFFLHRRHLPKSRQRDGCLSFRYRRLILILALGLPAWGEGITAQDPPLAGSRVRVFLRAAPQMATGRLVSASADSIWLDVGPEGTVGIGRDEIGRAERFVGVRGHARPGALIGFGAGAALGVIIGSTASTEDVDSGTFAVIFGFGLGAGGALLSAVIGSSVRREQWVPIVAWDSPPEGGTLRLGFRFALPGAFGYPRNEAVKQ